MWTATGMLIHRRVMRETPAMHRHGTRGGLSFPAASVRSASVFMGPRRCGGSDSVAMPNVCAHVNVVRMDTNDLKTTHMQVEHM